jgi:hypothetical protein
VALYRSIFVLGLASAPSAAVVAFAAFCACDSGSGGGAAAGGGFGDPGDAAAFPAEAGATCGTVTAFLQDGGTSTTTTPCRDGLVCGYRQQSSASFGSFDEGRCVVPSTASATQPCSGLNDPGVTCTGGSSCLPVPDGGFVCVIPAADGTACQTGQDCIHGVCGAGHCTQGNPGDPCDADRDPGQLIECKTGSCTAGKCG